MTASIINKILSIYNKHVTDEGLNLLINTPILRFNHLFCLGKYVFSSVSILTAEEANYSEEDIKTMLTKDRENPLLFKYNNDKTVIFRNKKRFF